MGIFGRRRDDEHYDYGVTWWTRCATDSRLTMIGTSSSIWVAAMDADKAIRQKAASLGMTDAELDSLVIEYGANK